MGRNPRKTGRGVGHGPAVLWTACPARPFNIRILTYALQFRNSESGPQPARFIA